MLKKTIKNKIPIKSGSFWTAGQRQASRLHEIAYRACFKPALPAYFIHRYSKKNEVVYDPFSGRGTTAIEAALSGRKVIANDINPISRIFTEPRLQLPALHQIEKRLSEINTGKEDIQEHNMNMFFHEDTLREILNLREYLYQRKKNKREDAVDQWIRMIATNRLTGHSPGYFSVYTLPPNQAVSRESQKKINSKKKQKPGYRNTYELILKKSKQLLKGLSATEIKHLQNASKTTKFLNEDARHTKMIPSNSVQLTITSPPFLNVVQYAADNWMRCWFNHIDEQAIAKKITMSKNTRDWCAVMQDVFYELYRITAKGGYVAFEVGEVRSGKIRLEEYVAPLGEKAGFKCKNILINEQVFTKTSNIWGIDNNKKGTNSNRIALFRK